MKSFTALVAGTLWLGPPLAASALELSHVQLDRVAFDPREQEPVRVRFALSAPAQVELRLYDDRDLRVRSVRSKGELPAGGGALGWDGRDDRGRVVLPEAYRFTLTAKTVAGETVEYDVTDLTGGEEVPSQAVRWDPATKEVSYYLPKAARVSLRAALGNGGPLLGTILDWVARPAGQHQESWSGRDASGVLDLSAHPGLQLALNGYTLPENTVFVLPLVQEAKLSPPAPNVERRVPKRKTPKRMYAHAQQPFEERGDFGITLALAEAPRAQKNGLPVVQGRVPVRVDLAAEHRERALERRFEVVFFLDGQFAFETEIGFAPMTVPWDLAGVNAGEHFLTANVRGYEGNFGAATLRVTVEPPPAMPNVSSGSSTNAPTTAHEAPR